MKQVQHVEAGDKIYILLKDEVKEIVLTDDHINNRSHVDTTFLVEKLRLASTAVENDQVRLEKGYYHDNSVGMGIDYGYYFENSEVKAFVSKEALEYYRDMYLANRIKLLKEDFEKMKLTVQEHLIPIVNAIKSHTSLIRRNQITAEERESLGYDFVNELYKAIYGESMF